MADTSFAEFANWEHFSDPHLDILRELLSLDALCPRSNHIVLKENGFLGWEVDPSPYHWSRQVEWPWSVLTADLQPTDVCLEVGGGWGVVQYAIAKRVQSLEEIDVNLDPMQHVRAMQTKYGLGRNITQRLGDARQLPYPDNSFDKVFSISVMEHLSNNHLQALTELVRVLKPGGKLLLTMDVNLGSPTSDFHLGVGSVGGLLKELGLEMPHNGPTKSIIMGTAHLVVILVCWEKPKEGIANKSGDV